MAQGRKRSALVGAGLAALALFAFGRRASADDEVPVDPNDPANPCPPGFLRIPKVPGPGFICVRGPDIEVPDDDEPTPPDADTPQDFIDDWLSPADAPRQRSFSRIATGGNPTQLARALVPGASAGNTQRRIRCTIRSGWNLHFYSRRQPQQNTAYYVEVDGRFYDIGPAWLPRNQNLVDPIAARVSPVRGVTATGAQYNPANIDGARTWGMPWIPPHSLINGQVVCAHQDPWNPVNMPPPEVLDWFGTSIDELRTRWETFYR